MSETLPQSILWRITGTKVAYCWWSAESQSKLKRGCRALYFSLQNNTSPGGSSKLRFWFARKKAVKRSHGADLMYELWGKRTHAHSSPNCGNVITTYLTSNLQTDGRDGKRAEHPNEAGHYYVISIYRAKQDKQNKKTSRRKRVYLPEICQESILRWHMW